MIDIGRIADGLAANLLNHAMPSANSQPLIAEAFRRGLQLGLSVRQPERPQQDAVVLADKDPAPWSTTH